MECSWTEEILFLRKTAAVAECRTVFEPGPSRRVYDVRADEIIRLLFAESAILFVYDAT